MKHCQCRKEEVPRWERISEERKQMVIPKLPHSESGKKGKIGNEL